MSRYCGPDNSEPILRAASEWREKALIEAGSVFRPNSFGLRRTSNRFVDISLTRKTKARAILDKLNLQLSPAEPQVKRLASEMLWLLLLCPSNVTSETKKQQIKTVWEWSGGMIPDSSALSTPVLEGIGSGGPGFHFFRWKELAFLIDVIIGGRFAGRTKGCDRNS